jgi:predicted dehydrogenase
MKICIFGFGSIGEKYYKTLINNFNDIQIFIISRRNISVDKCIVLNNKDELPNDINYAIISNPAPFHLETSFYFLDKNIPVLIEKPLSHNMDNINKLLEYKNVIHVGYQLKYSKLFKKLIDLLPNIGKINLIKINTGQYLPSWRCNDYRNCVSAQKKLGGGVLLELSHEIDYLLTILKNEPTHKNIIKEKLSDLDIDVEDTSIITLKFNNIIALISIDMINKRKNRTCEIIGSDATILLDFIENKIGLYDDNNPQIFNYEPENLLLNELNYFFECVKNKDYTNISLFNAINVLKIIK